MSRIQPWLGILIVLTMAALGGCGSHTTTTSSFRWDSAGDGMLDLLDGDRRVLRFMYAYDPATPESLHETYKCYHHVYDESGDHSLTKGPGGLYSHHRGLFIGWNRVMVDESTLDFWHMNSVTQRCDGAIETSTDGHGAQQIAHVAWCDDRGDPIISERRTITVHPTEPPTLLMLDFETTLTAVREDLVLDGDPEHAGVQFRAHQDVADGPADVKAMYQFHADDIDPHVAKDLPWAAMNFGLNGHRYWVLHINHPSNPEGTRYSAYRDYGRFGAFPVIDLPKGETARLRYRIVVGKGIMPTREDCSAHHAAFAATPSPRFSSSLNR